MSPDARTEIADANQAAMAIASLEKILDQLEQAVTEESACVRAGRLSEAMKLDNTKIECARLYAVESERVRAAKDAIARLMPDALDRLRRRHDAFQGLLRTNLTVLATAHAVSRALFAACRVNSRASRRR
jgi:hypothetical protein